MTMNLADIVLQCSHISSLIPSHSKWAWKRGYSHISELEVECLLLCAFSYDCMKLTN